jgi:hypothetical protein
MFYTYLWLREDGTPYYVGKGSTRRAFRSNSHRVGCPSDRTRIILQEFLSETEAFEAERFLIAYYGRADLGMGCLRNLTDGGEGAANPSEEQRRKLSDAHKGQIITDETRRKISEANKGKNYWSKGNTNRRGATHSDESRHKMSIARMGKIPWNKGKKLTEEQRHRLSESHKGVMISEETRRRMSEAQKGKVYSAESRRKMSESAKRRGMKKEHEVLCQT